MILIVFVINNQTAREVISPLLKINKMKRIILVFLFTFLSLTLFPQENVFELKHHFIVENQVMLTNTQNLVFFPILNNEFSITYGLTDYLETGLFYDIFNNSQLNSFLTSQTRLHLLGLKANLSLKTLMNKTGLSINADRFDLFFSGYFEIHQFRGSELSQDGYYDKKDIADWANYYKLCSRYFIYEKWFISASVGLINTNRVYIGLGLKL